MPSSARPNRVEVPRSRASWPSAESNTSDTMKSTNPMTSIQRSWYTNRWPATRPTSSDHRSEEHTSELQSQSNLVCRLLLEKKKTQYREYSSTVRYLTIYRLESKKLLINYDVL